MKNSKILSEQELAFVHEYVSNGFNGSKAYKAGFKLCDSEKEDGVARTSAYRLLKKPIIQDAIDAEEGSYKAMARGMEMSRKGEMTDISLYIHYFHEMSPFEAAILCIHSNRFT